MPLRKNGTIVRRDINWIPYSESNMVLLHTGGPRLHMHFELSIDPPQGGAVSDMGATVMRDFAPSTSGNCLLISQTSALHDVVEAFSFHLPEH